MAWHAITAVCRLVLSFIPFEDEDETIRLPNDVKLTCDQ